jgi:hypothetical protein
MRDSLVESDECISANNYQFSCSLAVIEIMWSNKLLLNFENASYVNLLVNFFSGNMLEAVFCSV